MKQLSKHQVNKLTAKELEAQLPFIITSNNKAIGVAVEPFPVNKYTNGPDGRFVWDMPGSTVAALRTQLITLLGGRCIRCSFDNVLALQIDHINGNGGEDRARFRSVPRYYKYIINTQGKGYQLLCANCNVIKAREDNEYGKPSRRPYQPEPKGKLIELPLSKQKQARGELAKNAFSPR